MEVHSGVGGRVIRVRGIKDTEYYVFKIVLARWYKSSDDNFRTCQEPDSLVPSDIRKLGTLLRKVDLFESVSVSR